MVRAAASLFLILLTGCAAVPKWSENPQDCNPDMWGEEYNHDLWNYAKAGGRIFEKAMPYICIENPEVVKRDLFEAMTMIAKTGEGPKNQIPSAGCSIKWKNN